MRKLTLLKQLIGISSLYIPTKIICMLMSIIMVTKAAHSSLQLD